MRILFFNRWVGCHVGGTENHIKGLAYGLADRGHEVSILTSQGGALAEKPSSVRACYVSRNKSEKRHVSSLVEDPALIFYAILFIIKAFVPLYYLSKQARPDVVSVHCTLEGLFFFFFRRLFGIPYVFVLEGFTNTEARLAKYADQSVTISDAVASRCNSLFGYRPIVIPPGINTAIFKPAGAQAIRKKNVVLNVNRLVKHKKVQVLVKAAKIVCEKNADAQFVIVGDGPDFSYLRNMVIEFGLTNNVHFHKMISDDELPSYYKSARLFVNCEGAVDDSWITCQEAMSCGTPIIWTPYEYVEGELIGGWGLRVPADQPNLLAQKILDVLENGKLWDQLSLRGIRKAKKMDWDYIVPSYEKVYLKAALMSLL